jgi:hypothetical protein
MHDVGCFQRSKLVYFGECQPLREYVRTPTTTDDGGLLVYRLDPWSRVEVAIEMLQEAVMVEPTAAAEPTLRAIAEVYARC